MAVKMVRSEGFCTAGPNAAAMLSDQSTHMQALILMTSLGRFHPIKTLESEACC